MNLLSFELREALPYMKGAKWQLLTALILHSNIRNRCWPSTRTLTKETGYATEALTEAKQWLIEHKAIELVSFDKRVNEEIKLSHRRHIYQLTGFLVINGKVIHYFTVSPEQVCFDNQNVDDVSIIESFDFPDLEVNKVIKVNTSSENSNEFSSAKKSRRKSSRTPRNENVLKSRDLLNIACRLTNPLEPESVISSYGGDYAAIYAKGKFSDFIKRYPDVDEIKLRHYAAWYILKSGLRESVVWPNGNPKKSYEIKSPFRDVAYTFYNYNLYVAFLQDNPNWIEQYPSELTEQLDNGTINYLEFCELAIKKQNKKQNVPQNSDKKSMREWMRNEAT